MKTSIAFVILRKHKKTLNVTDSTNIYKYHLVVLIFKSKLIADFERKKESFGKLEDNLAESREKHEEMGQSLMDERTQLDEDLATELFGRPERIGLCLLRKVQNIDYLNYQNGLIILRFCTFDKEKRELKNLWTEFQKQQEKHSQEADMFQQDAVAQCFLRFCRI